jgi:hypothetical protein
MGGLQEIISKKYKPTFQNGLPSFNTPLFDTWLGIHSISNTLARSNFSSSQNTTFLSIVFQIKIGKEKDICFWIDWWLEIGILKYLFPQLFVLSIKPTARTGEMGFWNHSCWSWNLSWKMPLKISRT